MDNIRTYFEDAGGSGPQVVFYAGLMEPLEASKVTGLAAALSGNFRLIYSDHRGHVAGAVREPTVLLGAWLALRTCPDFGAVRR